MFMNCNVEARLAVSHTSRLVATVRGASHPKVSRARNRQASINVAIHGTRPACSGSINAVTSTASPRLPRVLADLPVSAAIAQMVRDQVELVPWEAAAPIDAIYTYGHPTVNAALLDRLPGVRIISNFGVGVDHIDVNAASARGIPVGNTPGVLDGATADMAFTLLLAAGRRLAEGDRYARGPDFLRYDPSYLLGREIHGTTLGIIGMGRIGTQVARRARGFAMTVLYHNRQRRPEVEQELGVKYVPRDELLASADYVVLTVPLTRAGPDEADQHPHQRGARPGRRYRCADRSVVGANDLRCGARRDRSGAVAARPSAFEARQRDDRAAPGERHGADAATHGGDVDREFAGGVGRQGPAVSCEGERAVIR
jgi:D-isomer specific 2-hydroxyacid dehydrogenase, NAD binding domain/D-isomer specific 2-hydroxyacid dehydrogenase, catalytic domain